MREAGKKEMGGRAAGRGRRAWICVLGRRERRDMGKEGVGGEGDGEGEAEGGVWVGGGGGVAPSTTPGKARRRHCAAERRATCHSRCIDSAISRGGRKRFRSRWPSIAWHQGREPIDGVRSVMCVV